MVPVCALGHMRENFDRLQEYFTAIGVKMHMYLVDEAALGAIRPDPERYEVLEDRDSFDYIYSGEEMRVLPGRKYSKMKNRISRFHRDYGETAEFVILNPEDEGGIRTFLERWSKNKESDDDLNRLDSEEQGSFETIRFGREGGDHDGGSPDRRNSGSIFDGNDESGEKYDCYPCGKGESGVTRAL